MKLFARNFIVFIFILLGVFIFPSSANAEELQPGSVWEWTTATSSATQKAGLTNIVSVSAGVNHSLALKSDGTVWAWGNNQYGQLGNGEIGTSSATPVQVKTAEGYLTNIKAIAAGGDWFSLALKDDGTVWAWGNNAYGARGTGIGVVDPNASSKLLTATQVKTSNGFSQITAISAGRSHSVALKSDGSVFAWGWNDYGQTGTGYSIYSSIVNSPMWVMDSAASVAAGEMYSFAVKTDGTVWGWGRTYEGQLGIINGSYGVQSVPIQIPGISGIKSVWSKSAWSVALSVGGKIFEWGHRFSPDDRNPRQVPELGDVVIAAMGYGVGFAAKGDGNVWQWNADKNDIPKQISGLSNISSISIGGEVPNLAAVKISEITPTPDPTPTPTPTPKTPLILIPGIGGSEFKSNGNFTSDIRDCGILPLPFSYNTDEVVWVNGAMAAVSACDDYFDVLKLKVDGQTPEYSKIILNGNLFEGAYGNTIKFFTDNGYELGKTLFLFPYDWRKDVFLTAPLLDQKINDVKTQTGNAKVDIVAHSLGGLVARNYILDSLRAQNVRKLFTLGTPHLGAVGSLKNLRFGGCLTQGFWSDIADYGICLGVSPTEVKDIIQNMISGYELAPSKKYFDFYNGQDSNHLYPYRNNGQQLDYDQIKSFLTSLGYNTSLFNPSELFHALDNQLINTNGVEIINIAGSGLRTWGQIIEKEVRNLWDKIIQKKDGFSVSGDKTVPLFSASLIDYGNNKSLLGNAKVFYTKQNHGELVASGSALNLVKNVLEENSYLPDGISVFPYSFSGTEFSVYSPVNINIYDSLGNHTGPTINGDFEENIPGSSYESLDDAKFIFLPNDGNYDIKFEATDQGSFDFKIREYEDDTISQETSYKDIPLTISTKAETQFNTFSTESPVIHLDKDGNGTVDQDINPSSNLTGNEIFDQIPPQTNVQISGALGNNNWYKSDVLVSLIVEDDASGSGILKTEYSLDNGVTVNIYSEPFTISSEKINKLKFRSIDNAGNEEDPKEIEIKIDKTPPEAKISVDPDKQDLIVVGKDTNATTVIRSDNKLTKKKDDAFYTITDLVGNSLRIDVREKDMKKLDRFRIYSVQYNNDSIRILASNHFNVTYNGKRTRANVKEQNFELRNEVKIRIQYDVKKNKSTIIVKENKKERVREVKNGLVLLQLLTNKGQLITAY